MGNSKVVVYFKPNDNYVRIKNKGSEYIIHKEYYINSKEDMYIFVETKRWILPNIKQYYREDLFEFVDVYNMEDDYSNDY